MVKTSITTLALRNSTLRKIVVSKSKQITKPNVHTVSSELVLAMVRLRSSFVQQMAALLRLELTPRKPPRNYRRCKGKRRKQYVNKDKQFIKQRRRCGGGA